jgi:Tfp pilus assembly protein PilO
VNLPKLSKRERNLVVVWGVCVVVFTAIYFWPANTISTVGAVAETPQIEKRLTRLRRQVAGEPDRRAALKKLEDELQRQEKSLIQADTAAQAQAQMVLLVRRVASAQTPPITLNDANFGEPRRAGDYGEVVLTTAVDCQIDQILNFMVDVSNLHELIALTDVQLGQANGKKKIIQARLTFSGLVAGKLVPAKKSEATF